MSSAGFRAPFTRPGVWPEIRPGRFASTLRPNPDGCRCALLGLADDLGVKLNGGRPGASGGPSAFRGALARYGVPWDGERRRALDVPIYDAGDVVPDAGDGEQALLQTHERVARAVASLRERGLLVLCVGGGHDLSLPSIAAVSASLGAPLGGVNLDAHLDVREKVGSGMPFRRLIEGGQLEPRRFVELGLGRFVNEQRDLDWLHAQGGTAVHAEVIFEHGLDAHAAIELAAAEGPAFVSIDLDALDQSIAPGVSAPNPLGLSLRDAARLAHAAGTRREVQHFDLMEFNPSYDVDGHTARVAALLFLEFIAGLAERAP